MFAPDKHSQQQKKTAPNLGTIEVTLNQSEYHRGEWLRLMLETDKARKHLQDDDKKRLDLRVRDIQFLKKELQLKLEETLEEIDTLEVLQSRVVKALEACREPLRVTLLCLEERNKRVPCERVQDEVESELQEEKEVIENVSSVLQQALQQITEQIRLCRSAKCNVEKDLREKYEAECIDNACTIMTTHSVKSQEQYSGPNPVLASLTVNPRQWEEVSEINISTAEQQKTNSVFLRSVVESLLEQTAGDMRKQIHATTAAFRLNVHKIKSTKSQMEDQLVKIQSEIASQRRIKEDLLLNIKENEHFLSLAQARLELRRQRPLKEQCHDPAQAQLLAEVQQLADHINRLHEAVNQSEEEQRSLTRCELELQESINMKAISLYIDEVSCAQYRESVVIHNF
ncbi:tektin-1 [Solea solea]|uniref:tektin-1 n=1 Tax=Solea solea TaxID=90069 RepID=UPI00272CB7DD|nr:tektin-1 [Solea solea]XP_058489235.1 tektin-1 [Solea solea]